MLACLCSIVIGSLAWAAAPTIIAFQPANGPVGTVVAVTGTNLTGASEVNFNVTTATITTISATSLKVTVPTGATSGKIAVTTPDGTAISAVDFSVTSSTNAVDGAEMVWVMGGTFSMGSPEGVGNADEHPAHRVTLSGFWLYKYEVTVAQYRAFCTATGRTLPKFPSPIAHGYESNLSWEGKRGWDDAALQQHPIVNVNWNDAQAYAAWAKVALPTDAQWEYAARGPEGHNYPWGGMAKKLYDGWDATKCANYENSLKKDISTWPVGSFPAGTSVFRAHDMAGNVWEWYADWYGNYSATQVTNPTGPETGESRVLRGGCWNYNGNNDYRGADRHFDFYPGYRSDYVGFRCVSFSPAP